MTNWCTVSRRLNIRILCWVCFITWNRILLILLSLPFCIDKQLSLAYRYDIALLLWGIHACTDMVRGKDSRAPGIVRPTVPAARHNTAAQSVPSWHALPCKWHTTGTLAYISAQLFLLSFLKKFSFLVCFNISNDIKIFIFLYLTQFSKNKVINIFKT